MRRKARPAARSGTPIRVQARVVGRFDPSRDEALFYEHGHLSGEDFSGRKLMQFCTVGCHLQNCRFDNASIVNSKFGSGREMSVLTGCTFDGATMFHGGGFARFVRCSFRDVKMEEWLCLETEFIDCIFSGRICRCAFNGTVRREYRELLGRERNEFRGNDFSGSDLIEVDFRTGVDLSQQRLPSGPEYLYLPDAASAVERAREAVFAWGDAELRKDALVIIKCLAMDIEEGQRQLLLRADTYPTFSREAVDKLFALLQGR